MKDDYTRTTRRVTVSEIVAPLREASSSAARRVPTVAGVLASRVLASLGPNGEPSRVGSHPLVLASTADAEHAKHALESAIASSRS